MNSPVATHDSSRQRARPSHVRHVLGAGVLLLMSAVVLYVSGLSRAVGVVVAVVGGATILETLVARRRRAWPSRPWLITMAVLLLALVAYGVALLIYSATHPPVTV
jgi:predicted lysophospholipase L1 biosynthesis ABC-type transport system permease subunit